MSQELKFCPFINHSCKGSDCIFRIPTFIYEHQDGTKEQKNACGILMFLEAIIDLAELKERIKKINKDFSGQFVLKSFID